MPIRREVMIPPFSEPENDLLWRNSAPPMNFQGIGHKAHPGAALLALQRSPLKTPAAQKGILQGMGYPNVSAKTLLSLQKYLSRAPDLLGQTQKADGKVNVIPPVLNPDIIPTARSEYESLVSRNLPVLGVDRSQTDPEETQRITALHRKQGSADMKKHAFQPTIAQLGVIDGYLMAKIGVETAAPAPAPLSAEQAQALDILDDRFKRLDTEAMVRAMSPEEIQNLLKTPISNYFTQPNSPGQLIGALGIGGAAGGAIGGMMGGKSGALYGMGLGALVTFVGQTLFGGKDNKNWLTEAWAWVTGKMRAGELDSNIKQLATAHPKEYAALQKLGPEAGKSVAPAAGGPPAAGGTAAPADKPVAPAAAAPPATEPTTPPAATSPAPATAEPTPVLSPAAQEQAAADGQADGAAAATATTPPPTPPVTTPPPVAAPQPPAPPHKSRGLFGTNFLNPDQWLGAK